jgi:hypothetical protein
MRKKILASLTLAALVGITACGRDDRAATPGTTDQFGTPPATDMGPTQTPTTGPGMAPMAPGAGMYDDTLMGGPGATMPGMTPGAGAGTPGATAP